MPRVVRRGLRSRRDLAAEAGYRVVDRDAALRLAHPKRISTSVTSALLTQGAKPGEHQLWVTYFPDPDTDRAPYICVKYR